MAVFGLGWVSNALGSLGSWFGTFPAKLSGGQQPGQQGGGGGGVWAGRPATPEQALQLAAFWACVKLIGQTVGTLPVRLYTLQPDRSRAEAFEDPLYDLLQSQPNADYTGVEFWEGVAFCLALWGNAYALKTTRADGSLISIELLRPFWMTVVQDRNTREPVYRYSDPLLGYSEFTRQDLMHVRGFGACDMVALAPIQFARQTIGSALAAEESAGRLFSNGMRVGGWFKYKGGNGVMNAEQRQSFRDALIEPYTGTENAHKAGILPGDVDWIATSMNAEDAQLLANRRMNVEEICRWFGIPPILIGHAAEGQTMWGTGQESIVRSFLTMGLRPLVHRIEACIARDIIGRARRATMKAEFDLSELVRGDTKIQGDIDSQDVNNGLRTRNEVRASRNLPPMPGGDTLTVQSALIPIALLGTIAKLPRDKPVEPGADVDEGLKFNPHHGAHGRFATSDEAAAREAQASVEAAKHNIATIAKGAALVGVASLAVWLVPEAAAGTLGAAVLNKGASFISGTANGMFLSAGLSSASVILHGMGVDTTRAERAVASLSAVFKTAERSDEAATAALRAGLKHSADATLSAAAAAIEAQFSTSSNKPLVLAALKDACKSFKAEADTLTVPAALIPPKRQVGAIKVLSRDHTFSWETKSFPPSIDTVDLPFMHEIDGWVWVPGEVKAFNADQPRGPGGKWVKVGSDEHKAAIAHAIANPKIPKKSFAHYVNHDGKATAQQFAAENKLQADTLGKNKLTEGPKSEKSAIKAYSGADFYSTNDALRSGKDPNPVPLTKDLDSALAKTKLSESTTVFRGVKGSAVTKYPNMLKPGHVITDPGYQSTSVRKDVARKFAGAGGYVFHIHAYKGARALPLNGEKPPGSNALSHFPDEHEVLLPRSTSFRVLKVDKKSKTIHAELLG